MAEVAGHLSVAGLGERADVLQTDRRVLIERLQEAVRKLCRAAAPEERPALLASLLQDEHEELRDTGFELLHDAREEPWGQTVARLLSPEGLIVGISYAPALH